VQSTLISDHFLYSISSFHVPFQLHYSSTQHTLLPPCYFNYPQCYSFLQTPVSTYQTSSWVDPTARLDDLAIQPTKSPDSPVTVLSYSGSFCIPIHFVITVILSGTPIPSGLSLILVTQTVSFTARPDTLTVMLLQMQVFWDGNKW
jgi:hypothetical protein